MCVKGVMVGEERRDVVGLGCVNVEVQGRLGFIEGKGQKCLGIDYRFDECCFLVCGNIDDCFMKMGYIGVFKGQRDWDMVWKFVGEK